VSKPGANSIRLDGDFILQRLFSTFPNSWPGFGLLIQRLGVGIALMYLGTSRLLGTPGAPVAVARDFVEAAGGIFLLAGFWTPVMGALLAIDEVWIALSLNSSHSDNRLIHILLAVLTAGVAMLGPGAWSIDARLFGRKRFKMADRTGGRKSSL
jgi:putative oxidoreductase